MSNSRGEKRPSPFCLRLTRDERAALEARAGGMPLASFVKSILFAGDAAVSRRAALPLPVNRDALGHVLALLGASRLSSNLNQLAKAAHQGALPVTQEVEDDLKAACAHVAEMRSWLLAALGIKAMGTVGFGSGEDLKAAFAGSAEGGQ